MNTATPESRGISSAAIERFLRGLEEKHLPMHDILIARGDDLVFSCYYAPFTADMTHRQYSQTKSLVAIAVGFALQDGLLELDDTVEKYFSAEMEGIDDDNFRHLTIRHMMMMSTARPAMNWFHHRDPDRVREYFQKANPGSRPSGSFFEYDSSGTFVVGALIERLTGKLLMEYLREKFLDELGVHDDARCLKCPGGHSWSDSAILMRPEDMLKVGRFMLNGGSWNGKQLLNADYVREATSCLIETGWQGTAMESQGYGYYIWKGRGEGFFFNGMGSQFTACIPEKDIVFVCNGDTQGMGGMADAIIGAFYDEVAAMAGDPLPEDPAAQQSLADYTASLKLFAAYGEKKSPLSGRINGKEYILSDNPMGISRFVLTFADGAGSLTYTNRRGEMVIPFGLTENVFGDFPEPGYSNEIGSVPGDRPYRCAASGAWREDSTFWLKVQIIDDYFGNMDMIFAFDEADESVVLSVSKTAEDFLHDYAGNAAGKING